MPKKLTELVKNINPLNLVTDDIEISRLCTNSKQVVQGDLFIAIPGHSVDGHQYVQEAIENGAASVLVNGRDVGSVSIPLISVANPRRALSKLASEFYNNPSEKLNIIGITGTNGKTTTTQIIDHIIRFSMRPSSSLGTLGFNTPTGMISTGFTTPESIDLHQILKTLKDGGIEYIPMEVSSHAIEQFRVADVDFNYAVFTNLTQDHLDYHHTMEDYFQAKAKLFKMLPLDATAIINLDCQYGKILKTICPAPVVSTSSISKDMIQFSVFQSTLKGINGEIIAGNKIYPVHSPLIGDFNRENILMAVATAHSMNICSASIENGIRNCTNNPGRMEYFKKSNSTFAFT